LQDVFYYTKYTTYNRNAPVAMQYNGTNKQISDMKSIAAAEESGVSEESNNWTGQIAWKMGQVSWHS
jgi:phage-related protein